MWAFSTIETELNWRTINKYGRFSRLRAHDTPRFYEDVIDHDHDSSAIRGGKVN